MTGPYAGLRVLDFSHVIAGPFCTRLLADMGAEVIRIEPVGGDLMRNFPVSYGPGLSSAFAQYNWGKRSVSLDLRVPQAVEIALQLVERSDVVVENFSPGTFEKLGLGYEVLRARKPDVILCSISTFGRVGAYAGLSGYGMVAEAYSGLMMLIGDEGGPPSHFGTPLADVNAGVHALAAIGAALYRRAQTGQGTHIDISAFDALFSMIDQAVGLASFSRGRSTFGRYGTTHPTSVPHAVIEAADGRYVTYAAVGDRFWRRMTAAIGRPELADDPRYATLADRIARRHELYDMIRDWARGFATADALVEHLRAHDIPVAAVRAVEENLHDPHLLQRGTLAAVQVDGIGEVVLQSAPYLMTGTEIGPGESAPRIGQHTAEVLASVLDMTADEVDELRRSGAVHIDGGAPA